MLLDIKTPCYYEQHYQVDKEIVQMCQNIAEKVKGIEYSEKVQMIDVLPVVAPEEVLEDGSWKEEVTWNKSIGRASVFKHIDYELYMNGTIDVRRKLTIQCVIDAIWMIKKKPGTKMNAKQFKSDLLKFIEKNEWQFESDYITNANNEVRKFSVSMNSGKIFEKYELSKPMIKEMIIFIRNQVQLGNNDEFFTLINDETEDFVQTVLEEDGYHVEVRYMNRNNQKGVYAKQVCTFEEAIAVFHDFYDGVHIEISDFEDISNIIYELKCRKDST